MPNPERSSPSRRRPLRGTRIVVCGAGLAGLTAAHVLRERGATVTVFEARDRVGGRVQTVRSPFADDQHGEAGGELIEEGHHRLRALAESFGLRLVPVLSGGFGAYLALDGEHTKVRSQNEMWTRLREALGPWLQLWDTADRRWDGEIARALGGLSVSAVLREAGAEPALFSLAVALRGYFMADPDRLSILPLLDELSEEGSPGKVAQYRIEGGADRLPHALAAQLGQDLQLRHIVVGITDRPLGVTVSVRGVTDEPMSCEADYAVVALPPPIVHGLQFAPPLPERQAAAYATLSNGEGTKLLLQFARPFWRERREPQAWATDLPIGAVWDASEEQPGRPAILTLLAGGTASAALRDRLSRDGVAAVVGDLAWLGSPTDVIASHVTTWEEDAWARGAYATFTHDFRPNLRAWLAHPCGRVHFAGEATSVRFPGYMNGAVESGFRVAAEIEWAVTGRTPGIPS